MGVPTSFFTWYDGENENGAKRIFAECPSRAARDFNENPPYGIQVSQTINVRNIDGKPFKYTLDQLYREDSNKI